MYTIEQVVPHRAPMVLLDELIRYDELSATCKVTIRESASFYDSVSASVPSHVGIEYMAQSIAAYAGAHELDRGKPKQVGFLLGSRKYICHTKAFNLHQQLLVQVTMLYQETSGLSVFDCQIRSGDTLLAEAKLNTFQPKNADQYIHEHTQPKKGSE